MANPSKASVRARECWSARLRVSERELVCNLAGVAPGHAHADWKEIPPEDARRIVIAFRDLAQLGVEASYALGYISTKSRSNT